MTRRDEVRRLRADVRRLGAPPDDPNAVLREYLDDLLPRMHVADYGPEQNTAQAHGFGPPCPRDDHRNGCPVASGWVLATLRVLADGSGHLWPPADPYSPLPPPPPCIWTYLRSRGHTAATRACLLNLGGAGRDC